MIVERMISRDCALSECLSCLLNSNKKPDTSYNYYGYITAVLVLLNIIINEYMVNPEHLIKDYEKSK